jgi:hypothetical protein
MIIFYKIQESFTKQFKKNKKTPNPRFIALV